jgi:hypothetical protein
MNKNQKNFFDNKTVMKLLAKGFQENILQGSCMLQNYNASDSFEKGRTRL